MVLGTKRSQVEVIASGFFDTLEENLNLFHLHSQNFDSFVFSRSIADHGVKEIGTGCFLSLRHPKSGNLKDTLSSHLFPWSY